MLRHREASTHTAAPSAEGVMPKTRRMLAKDTIPFADNECSQEYWVG